ncbi:hypothetical protein [Hyphococcus sp.]|uniref:hypothetical protein n=1 Tax=Hyphococcus sp. TaxID=2038636 RepID=UPI0020808659|nr:MAG: hypothetical protein DHS20C04_10000 [Marinicaulis sp.]
MILRRVIAHFRKQEWTAIALDFLIVVVGVFIGIQVANWNAARADRELGRDYTHRLISDLEQDLADARSLFGYYGHVLDSVVETDRLLSSPGSDAQALIVAAYRASEFNNNPPNSATWDEIVSSGQIGLLPSGAIEGGLSDYYKFQAANDDVNIRLIDSPYRLAVRSLIPLPLQLAIREGCSDDLDDINVARDFMSECVLNIDASIINKAAETLRSSPALHESLRHQYTMVASVQINNRGNIVLLDRVLGVLNAKDSE